VPLRARIAQRLERSRQARSELRQQRPQRSGNRAQSGGRKRRLPQRLDQRAQRERLAQLLTPAQVTVPTPKLRPRQQLIHQPCLADAGLALHHHEARRLISRLEQQRELALASDQDRRAEPPERRSRNLVGSLGHQGPTRHHAPLPRQPERTAEHTHA
jgi:hypothetical protein